MKNNFSKVIKFNGGLGAILCNKCAKIIKTGRDFDEIERQYCSSSIEDENYKNVIKILNKRLKNGYYICNECKNIE